MKTMFNLQDTFSSDFIYKILREFGALSFEELTDFYQIVDVKRRRSCCSGCINFLKDRGDIYWKDGQYSIVSNEQLYKDTQTKAFKRTIGFLLYLIQLKDDSGRYRYWKSIQTIEKVNNIMPCILVKLNDYYIFLQYCPSNNIDEYNFFVKMEDKDNELTNDIRRILISDIYLDCDKVDAENVINIALVDDDESFHIVR